MKIAQKISFIYLLNIGFLFCAMLKPYDGAHLNYIYIEFEWDQIPQAEYYQLQISKNIEFSNPELDIDHSNIIYIDKNSLDWDNQYYWRVRPIFDQDENGSWIDTASFSTGGTLSNTTVTVTNANSVEDGITVFGAFFNYFSAAIDESGKEIWNSGMEDLVYYNSNQYGNVFGCTLMPGTENNLPGKEFTFQGETIWEEPNDDFLHHDLIQLPNGNYLGIVETTSLGPIPIGDWTPLFMGLGFQADGVSIEFPWVGDKLVEWDKETGEIVWEWNVFDNFNMIDFDQFGGTWNQAYIDLHYDWTHVNAVIYEESQSALYISTRHLSRITKIDYPSGDVIWNLGHNMMSDDVTMGTDIGFSFQHSIQILDNGNILTFDNGNLAEQFRGLDSPQSRAIEISTDGISAELVWSYELPSNLYGFASGNTQKLDNGNVLVTTVGGGGRSLEVDTNGDIVWEGNYNLSLPNGAVYRAHRIPGLYPTSFSVLVHDLLDMDNGPGINLSEGSVPILFDIINEGDYELEINFSVSDQFGWLNPTEGNLILSPNSSETLSFNTFPNEENEISQIELIVTPTHHQDKQKIIQIDGYSNLLRTYSVSLPKLLKFDEPSPNPFNPKTKLRFIIHPGIFGKISLQLFDLNGRLVEDFNDDHIRIGENELVWDAKDYSSGLYFARLFYGKDYITKKLILMK